MTHEKAGNRELIEEKQLSNRMVLALYDQSRRVAEDTWFVKLQGEARIELTPDFFDSRRDAPETIAAVRERMGQRLRFAISKEQKFVDDGDKETVLGELLNQVRENMLSYLNNPSFPGKLFHKQYEEHKTRYLMELRCSRPAAEQEDDGPADFSFCFRD